MDDDTIPCCDECGRAFPVHYSNCPHRTRRVHAAKPGEWPPYEERTTYIMPYGSR